MLNKTTTSRAISKIKLQFLSIFAPCESRSWLSQSAKSCKLSPIPTLKLLCSPSLLRTKEILRQHASIQRVPGDQPQSEIEQPMKKRKIIKDKSRDEYVIEQGVLMHQESVPNGSSEKRKSPSNQSKKNATSSKFNASKTAQELGSISAIGKATFTTSKSKNPPVALFCNRRLSYRDEVCRQRFYSDKTLEDHRRKEHMQCPFFDKLPIEVRRNIYRWALEEDGLLPAERKTNRNQNVLSLLATCTQMHYEAFPIAYEKASYTVNGENFGPLLQLFIDQKLDDMSDEEIDERLELADKAMVLGLENTGLDILARQAKFVKHWKLGKFISVLAENTTNYFLLQRFPLTSTIWMFLCIQSGLTRDLCFSWKSLKPAISCITNCNSPGSQDSTRLLAIRSEPSQLIHIRKPVKMASFRHHMRTTYLCTSRDLCFRSSHFAVSKS